MGNSEEVASIIRAVMRDRLDNSTQPHLAFEVATLRGYIFSAIDRVLHLARHIERSEIQDIEQMHAALMHIATSLTSQLANLDDVRDALKAHENGLAS